MKASTLNAVLLAAAGVAAVALLTSVQSSMPRMPATPFNPQPTPLPAREAVARAALSQVGNGDPKRYWDDALPGVNVGKANWCGPGALWCLHQAGLALGRHWKLGSGFLLTPPPLPTTKQPDIGDIAYFDHNEHHAVVVQWPCWIRRERQEMTDRTDDRPGAHHADAAAKTPRPLEADAFPGPPHNDWLVGGGEVGELMRAIDWSKTPLGPTDSWPQSLRTAVSICPARAIRWFLWWGTERWMFYNDAYRPMLGERKHPQFLGRPGPMMDQVIDTGGGDLVRGFLSLAVAQRLLGRNLLHVFVQPDSRRDRAAARHLSTGGDRPRSAVVRGLA